MIKEPIFTGNNEKDMQLIKDSISALVRYVNSLDQNYINTGEAVGIDDVFGIYSRVGNIEQKTSTVLTAMKTKQAQEANTSGTANHSTIASVLSALIDAMES